MCADSKSEGVGEEEADVVGLSMSVNVMRVKVLVVTTSCVMRSQGAGLCIGNIEWEWNMCGFRGGVSCWKSDRCDVRAFDALKCGCIM